MVTKLVYPGGSSIVDDLSERRLADASEQVAALWHQGGIPSPDPDLACGRAARRRLPQGLSARGGDDVEGLREALKQVEAA